MEYILIHNYIDGSTHKWYAVAAFQNVSEMNAYLSTNLSELEEGLDEDEWYSIEYH